MYTALAIVPDRYAVEPAKQTDDLPRLDPTDLMMWADYQQRPPNWRWAMIVQHIDEDTSPDRAEDPVVHHGCRYYRRYVKLGNVGDMSEEGVLLTAPLMRQRRKDLVRDHPAIALAHYMHINGEDTRWLVEAQICANVPVDEIALDVASTPLVIAVYEAMFFDIRDRLRAEGYMTAHILKPEARRGNYVGQKDLLWKEIAYRLGRDMLRQIRSGGTLPQEALAKLEELSRANSVRDHVISQELRPITGFTAKLISEEYVAIKANEAASGGMSQLSGEATRGAEVLAASIKFVKGSVQGPHVSAIEDRSGSMIKYLEAAGFLANRVAPEEVTTHGHDDARTGRSSAQVD